jgi:preprotein translocase subunit SecG
MIFSVLTVIVCILLISVILIQNSKGGGIQSQYSAATQIMGVKKGTEFIEKATWGLAIALILLSVLMAPQSSGTVTSDEDAGSVTKRKAQGAVTVPQQQAPAQPLQQAPADQAPAQQPQQTPPPAQK